MRMLRWLLAATLVVSFSTFGIAQSSKEKVRDQGLRLL
jgi:hypothetical protein